MKVPRSLQAVPVWTHEIVTRLCIPGEPVPKGRPRFGRGRTYTPRKTREAELAIRWAVVQARRGQERTIETGPLAVRCDFYRATGRTADLDNLVKTVKDALNGIVWQDDRQVISLQAHRFDHQPNPRTEVAVYRVRRMSVAGMLDEG